MGQPEPLSVDDALDRLVNQFSDSMAFFRELIQNALDAGSEEVEIDFAYEDGKLVIHVDDWGAGMNREIIDTRLTRLFSSSKDGDRTKIGKFGIGFVSVFAIDPDAVCIDTSRDGEHWRIVFDDKRKFSLIRRDQPTEGTKIRIFKTMSRGEFQAFTVRAAEVVRYWCKHVAGEIRVAGELVNEDFDLDAPVKVRRQQDEELVVIGHRVDGHSFAGFYNRGLTLTEQELIPGVAFKASSANLEHTLTRDDVIREAGFERLMARVHGLIADELCTAVFTALDEAARALDPSSPPSGEARDRIAYLWRCALWHEQAEHDLPERAAVQQAAIFRSPAGRLLTLSELRKGRGKGFIVAARSSPLTEILERAGQLVLWLPADFSSGRALATALSRDRVQEVERWCTALPPRDSREAVRWQVLANHVARLLDDWGAKLAGVRLGHLDYPDSSVRERVIITQSEFGEATQVEQAGELGTSLLSSRRTVVLNADHPTVRTIAALAQSEPELAAYFAVKAFFLGSRLDAATDEALAGLTFDARLKRTG
ncbi:MAG: ATP-binding protein [Myxococcales bacterium]|nr:ATP-binding protein [Myxococcales bacterium]